MLYDIICISLIILAFVGGYQNTTLQGCNLLFSALVGFLGAIFLSPFILTFYETSIGASTSLVKILIALLFGLLIGYGLFRILQLFTQAKETRISLMFSQSIGGFILAAIMVISISVLTSFTDQAMILSEQVKTEAHLYRWLDPINEKTSTAWSLIRTNVGEVANKE